MENFDPDWKKYLLAASLGALDGGVFVVIATRALPRMMSQMMSGMMRNMMSQMGEAGCDPAEM
jgi:hypothetical protein